MVPKPINEARWRPILNALIQTVKRFPDSREKRMALFYLEELHYRFWHYKLGVECICTDIDFVEYKFNFENPQILGLFEIKTPLSSRIRPGIPAQEKIELFMAKKLNVPLWHVIFTRDLKMFELQRIDVAEPPLTLTEQEYINFHRKKLRGL